MISVRIRRFNGLCTSDNFDMWRSVPDPLRRKLKCGEGNGIPLPMKATSLTIQIAEGEIVKVYQDNQDPTEPNGTGAWSRPQLGECRAHFCDYQTTVGRRSRITTVAAPAA